MRKLGQATELSDAEQRKAIATAQEGLREHVDGELGLASDVELGAGAEDFRAGVVQVTQDVPPELAVTFE